MMMTTGIRRLHLSAALTLLLSGTIADLRVACAGDVERGAAVRERMKDRRSERATAADSPALLDAGDHRFTLFHDGIERHYRVHVPSRYDPSHPTPLVVALHGGGGNMDIQATDEFYGLIAKSEEAGFIALFPNGFSRFASGRLATWNAGNCCGKARDRNVDDVGFIRAVLADVGTRGNIDPQRVYATGISNGAMMAYRLACEMSASFAAIMAVAGTDNTRSCSPSRPVPVLHVHAQDDELVLFGGGAGRRTPAVTDFVSVPDSIAKWRHLDGCDATARRVFESSGAYCDAYTGCRNGTEVRLCVTASGGHSWPGGIKPRGGEAGSTALSATDEMWRFFSRF